MSAAEAKAVIEGLAGFRTETCECGQEHQLPTDRKYWRLVCLCGSSHSLTRALCPCGIEHKWGPRAGWRMISRSKKNYTKIIADLRKRVAELEAA